MYQHTFQPAVAAAEHVALTEVELRSRLAEVDELLALEVLGSQSRLSGVPMTLGLSRSLLPRLRALL